MVKPRSFSQASQRRHTRHGRHYDPNAAHQAERPLFVIGAILSVVVVLAAAIGLFFAFRSRSRETESEIERIQRSQQWMAEMRSFRSAHPGDSEIEAVERFVQEHKKDLVGNEVYEAADLLRQLSAQKSQREFRQKIDRLLADVRAFSAQPEMAVPMRDKAAELERLLGQLDDDRAKEIKNEIFAARGTSALAAAEYQVKKADEMVEKGERDLGKVLDAYDRADKELAEVLVAQRFPKAKDIHEAIAMKVNDLAEKWGESASGFAALPARDLLDPREFVTAAGSDKAPWQTSPGAKIRREGSTLVVEGVKPERADRPGERAGIAFWSPTPDTSIRHYEVRMRVRLVKTGFSLLARQSTGYMRHLYEFEVLPAGANPGDNYYPTEGHVYEIVERVGGRKVRIEVVPQDADEPSPSVVESTTSAREGGIGFLVKPGAEVVVERISVKILR